MYQPVAASSAGDYEFIELHNIGTTALDLSGVRFTNGLDYTFPAGTTLAAGAYTVVAKSRTAFTSRYPSTAHRLARTGPVQRCPRQQRRNPRRHPAGAVVDVHIVKFPLRVDVVHARRRRRLFARRPPADTATAARDWSASHSTWRASTAVNGNPGAADAGGVPASR
jgi:hypothetical protein